MDIKKYILCTSNKDKINEIKIILGDFFSEFSTLSEIGIRVNMKESGKTFFENAFLKAKKVYLKTKISCVAEDSGLIVPALNNMPGIFSSRFAGKEKNYSENNEKLLLMMKGIKDRKAYFLCSVVAILKGENKLEKTKAIERDTEVEIISGEDFFIPQTLILRIESRVYGIIQNEIKGDYGFGYDPLFYYPPYGKTFAELTAQEKNKASHRGKAFRELKRILQI